MKNSGEHKRISVDNLLLDLQNPRLPKIAENQKEALELMATTIGGQLVVLAAHIIEHGLDISNLPIVIAADKNSNKLISLDGNRRLSALRALETPTILEGVLAESHYKKLVKLSQDYIKDPAASILCVEYSSRKEANIWLQVKHRGAMGGAGHVEWSGQVGAKFDERSGSKSLALQVLRFVQERAELTGDTKEVIDKGKFPVTTLERIIRTSKPAIGLTEKEGIIRTKYDAKTILPFLKRVVEDIGSKKISVSKVKNLPERSAYIEEIKKLEFPDNPTPGKKLVTLDKVAEDISPSKPKAKPRPTPDPDPGKLKRTVLIPYSLSLNIPQARIHALFQDLKSLNCDERANTVGIIFRVFVELSLDYYAEHTMKRNSSKFRSFQLSQKIGEVARYLQNEGYLHEEELEGFHDASKKESVLCPGYKSLHSYIHNYHHDPLSTDLKRLWNNIQKVFTVIWN